ncbi:hypothetical protein [Citrobacter sp. BDA59-3]|uniref:hypothetical protein n=1 Tax=Citrobacter sp. BDA59-3 TaxID=2781952 RepID=UPI00351BFB87
MGSLALKQFDTVDPELSKHLSNANRISSKIACKLKNDFSTPGGGWLCEKK